MPEKKPNPCLSWCRTRVDPDDPEMLIIEEVYTIPEPLKTITLRLPFDLKEEDEDANSGQT